jgi:hypothetical protein
MQFLPFLIEKPFRQIKHVLVNFKRNIYTSQFSSGKGMCFEMLFQSLKQFLLARRLADHGIHGEVGMQQEKACSPLEEQASIN